MAIPTKTFADLRTAVQDQVRGAVDQDGTATISRILKRAVREVVADVDLRSTKRKMQIALAGQEDTIFEETDGTFDLPTVQAIGAQANTYEFLAPNDLKGQAIIDIRKRADRVKQYMLTTEEEFDRRKTIDDSLVAISDNSWLRKLLLTGVPTIDTQTIHNCDTYNGNGTFTAVGGASTIATEATDKVEGDGAVSFNSDLGTATAGIQNTTMAAVDLTSFVDHDLFVWVYIPNASLITSFTLRWGSSSGNYFQRTVVSTHDNLAFYAGWNLLRFPWDDDVTETGTPDESAVDFISFFMTKDAGKAAATGWIVDRIIASVNPATDVIYYSKYGFQDSDGTHLEDAASDTDFVNADTDEFDLMVLMGCRLTSIKLGLHDDVKMFDDLYQAKRQQYVERSPSEALLVETTQYHLGSLSGSTSSVMTTD